MIDRAADVIIMVAAVVVLAVALAVLVEPRDTAENLAIIVLSSVAVIGARLLWRRTR